MNDQLIMSRIGVAGSILIPLGLAASTISSAIGSVLVAPRTLQAIGVDRSMPIPVLNKFFASGRGDMNEPFNSTIVTSVIAMIFVILGDVNAVAEIISMFFMVTYGSICLISFLHHFGSDPSYRPTFRSRWYFSLIGFIFCIWLMFQMSSAYAFLSIFLMIIMYIVISRYHKDRMGLELIFQGAVFQLSRKIQVYLQKVRKLKQTWRPSAVCISKYSFERDKAFDLLNWISYRHGFGTYIHLIEGYYSKASNQEAKNVLKDLISMSSKQKGNMYVDTMISPSYTSAIAQLLQIPSPSGMENNMVIFEYDKNKPEELQPIVENIALTRAGEYDVCVLGSSVRNTKYENGIHVWIRNLDEVNANLMILLSFIILGHPDWDKSFIKIFNLCDEDEVGEIRKKMSELVVSGRLPITERNIEILIRNDQSGLREMVNEKSRDAGLTIIGFKNEQLVHEGIKTFEGYDRIGDILFINAYSAKKIQ